MPQPEDMSDNGTSSPFSLSPFSSRPTSPHEQRGEAQVASAEDCDAVLESIDSCVACAEGVNVQQKYEDELVRKDHMAADHGLSDAEAALVRLQVMDEQKKRKGEAASTFALPDTLDLNLCGYDDDGDEKVPRFPSATQATPPTLRGASSSDEAVEVRSLSPASLSSVNSLQAVVTCAICFDGADGDGTPKSRSSAVTFCHLPCCGSDGGEETSTAKVCTACILLLTSPISDGQERVGRCPRCRAWIAVTTEADSVAIRAVESAGKCKICNQVKTVLVENDEVCDACFLGRRRPLFYECQQCHLTQRIPHPLYRYQPSVDRFGSNSWTCNRHCKKFTMWRIVSDQVRCVHCCYSL